MRQQAWRRRGRWEFPVVVVIAAVIAFFGAQLLFAPMGNALKPGSPVPPIVAAGWINGPPPNLTELAGRVVVLEVWASW